MDDLKKLVPTNDELRAIIEKLAEFVEAFFKLFDQLKAGIAETFGTYKSVYGETTTAAAPEEEE